jgi:hypothetical protein
MASSLYDRAGWAAQAAEEPPPVAHQPGRCPACRSDRTILITPIRPGPVGWGGRCKACGYRWSLDAPAESDPDHEPQDAD